MCWGEGWYLTRAPLTIFNRTVMQVVILMLRAEMLPESKFVFAHLWTPGLSPVIPHPFSWTCPVIILVHNLDMPFQSHVICIHLATVALIRHQLNISLVWPYRRTERNLCNFRCSGSSCCWLWWWLCRCFLCICSGSSWFSFAYKWLFQNPCINREG